MRLLCLVLMVVSGCASAKDDSAAKPRATRELAVGGARLHGGGMRMDVQIGRKPTTQPLIGGAVRVTPAGTVTP